MTTNERTGRPCIFGEVLFDRFPDGSQVLGGAPFNVAWNLQALGAEPLFISRVGADPLGKAVRAQMDGWGMQSSGVQIDSDHATGSVDITLVENEPAYDIVAGVAYDNINAGQMPNVSPALVYHGSLAVRRSVSRDALDALIKANDAPVFLDVNLRSPWWDAADVLQLLDRARWAKLNEHELAELSSHAGPASEQARQLLGQCSLDKLIVTMGAAGAFVISADGESHSVRPSASSQLVDTVGAGDAFASVCLLGLLRGWELHTMLERAQQFAAAVVGIRGATVADRRFYLPYVEQWQLSQQQ
jgi:fructokinase